MVRDCFFEFRRKLDGLVYRFEPCDPINGVMAWKRTDLDIWLAWIPAKGWCTIDINGVINSRPWCLDAVEQELAPPETEWVSKKGDKSYVYDLVRVQ